MSARAEGPSAEVLAAFGLSGPLEVLNGGSEPVYLVDGVVLKRADAPEELDWKCELLARIPEEGFRLARPVMTTAGGWSAGGWMATRWVPGRHAPPDWTALVAAERAFHAALADEARPVFLDHLGHRWARAHRVVLEQARFEPLESVRPRWEELEGFRRAPAEGDRQLIHADLAGNVLLTEGAPPAILDFSPWWGPVAYAEGILMADALMWFGADRSALRLVDDRPRFPEMLARGALFRLVAVNEAVREGHPEYLDQLDRFDDVIGLIRSLIR